MGDDLAASVPSNLPLLNDIRKPFNVADLDATLSYARQANWSSLIRGWLRAYGSPYLYRFMPRMRERQIRSLVNKGEMYTLVHAWNPASEASLVQYQLQELVARCQRLGVTLFVVNLPEHRMSRELYGQGRYEQYLSLVRQSLGTVPFLDLRELLSDDEFYDGSHAAATGARRITERVVWLMKSQMQEN